MISIDSIYAYYTKPLGVIRTLYQCVYTPSPRIKLTDKELTERKCLQMRSVLNLIKKGNSKDYETTIRLGFELVKIRGDAKIEDENEYQQMLKKLVDNHCDVKSGILNLLLVAKEKSFGIVNYVGNCPDLFFNDLIEKIIQSQFSKSDKLETINRILNCYHKYITDLIEVYSEKPDENPSPTEQLLNLLEKYSEGKISLKIFATKEIESLLQSYKIALNHLLKLSKEYSWRECLDNLGSAFAANYKIEYINALFKLITVIPDCSLKKKLCEITVNYLTFMQFNEELTIITTSVQRFFGIVGVCVGINVISSTYIYALAYATLIIAISTFMLSPLVSFEKHHPSIHNFIVFNNNILCPLLYLYATIVNFYIIGSFIYS